MGKSGSKISGTEIHQRKLFPGAKLTVPPSKGKSLFWRILLHAMQKNFLYDVSGHLCLRRERIIAFFLHIIKISSNKMWRESGCPMSIPLYGNSLSKSLLISKTEFWKQTSILKILRIYSFAWSWFRNRKAAAAICNPLLARYINIEAFQNESSCRTEKAAWMQPEVRPKS